MDLDKLFGNQNNDSEDFEAQEKSAKFVFNMFMSFVNAGFEREEALKIVIALMTHMLGGKENGI